MSKQEEETDALEESDFVKHGFRGCAIVETDLFSALIEQEHQGGASQVVVLLPGEDRVGIATRYELGEKVVSVSTHVPPAKAEALADALRYAAEDAREQARGR